MPATRLCFSIRQFVPHDPTRCGSALEGSSRRGSAGWLGAIALLLAGCSALPPASPRQIHIHQSWPLQPGRNVAGYMVTGGIGDVSLNLRGGAVMAPFDGQVQQGQPSTCVLFSSRELPAYLLRLCGLQQPKIGAVRQGEVIGTGRSLHFAALRKQPDGTWALVEPSLSLLDQTLTRP